MALFFPVMFGVLHVCIFPADQQFKRMSRGIQKCNFNIGSYLLSLA